MKRTVESDRIPKGSDLYSPALVAGGFLFISGQGPEDPVTDKAIGTTVEEQTLAALDKMRNILEAAGASLDDVVKVNAYLSDVSYWAGYNSVYRRYFRDPKPCRTTIVANMPDIMIEVDCIAYIGDR